MQSPDELAILTSLEVWIFVHIWLRDFRILEEQFPYSITQFHFDLIG